MQAILSRTLSLGSIEMPGIARVLDVTRPESGGLIVSEWLRGGSLHEVAATSPSALGSARATQSLAAAAEAAHRGGVALSIDHPSRVRVSIHGHVALAFPATMPHATPQDDVRGIGAALYALLVNKWPLRAGRRAQRVGPAEVDPDGVPVEPRAINHQIPFQISAAAARAVQEGGGITTATTLLNLLQQATAVADRTELISPVAEPAPPPPTQERRERFRGWAGPTRPTPSAPGRRRVLLIGSVCSARSCWWRSLVLASFLSNFLGNAALSLNKGGLLGLNAIHFPLIGARRMVKPLSATVFSPKGEADNREQANLAIDGNPNDAWTTDVYRDAVPFPPFKNGVGLLLQLPEPTKLAAVGLDVPSTGTKVEIRAANTATPASWRTPPS